MFMKAFTAATTAAFLIATPAIAQSNATGKDAAQSMKIKYADLNLASAEGQARLERRIDAAAKKVCQLGKHRTGTRIPSTERKECYAKARQSARSQMASLMNSKRLGG